MRKANIKNTQVTDMSITDNITINQHPQSMNSHSSYPLNDQTDSELQSNRRAPSSTVIKTTFINKSYFIVRYYANYGFWGFFLKDNQH